MLLDPSLDGTPAVAPLVDPVDPIVASGGMIDGVSLLMPARPASLIPAVGAGVGKVAVGVLMSGPPNGAFAGTGTVD